jgi:UDP-N-acetylmuramate: L-alanyl-gamma-D-glutamyl-meso-diaminopimelate ligase
MSLPGEFNVRNALGVTAIARWLGLSYDDINKALASFRNAKRRLELKGEFGGVRVYDDFAHHPTAIRMTLDGLRNKVNGARILAVLEPRSNTMKLGVMKDALAGSLADADRVFCYSAGLGWDPSTALAALGARGEIHGDMTTLVTAIADTAKAGDHVLIMSNGGFGGIHEKLLARLNAAHG